MPPKASSTRFLLPAPSSRNNEIAVTIRAAAPPDTNAAVDTFMGYGCPRHTAVRAASALRASGRYDCRISNSIPVWMLCRDLREIGCTIEPQE